MLEIRNVVGGYEDIKVLRGVSLDVRGGEIVGLLGPNGHGKSTLLKAISGVHPATGGSIRFMDEEIVQAPPHRIVEAGLAYIPEERFLFSDMTVLENLQLGAYARTARPEYRRNLELVFHVFPRLKERQHQVCMTMSGGEGRMLAIARGLMSGARLLLIDEPSIGLAPGMKKSVYGAILRINQDAGITVLLVEQEIDYALRLTNRIYMLKRGEVQFERPSAEATVEELKEAYF